MTSFPPTSATLSIAVTGRRVRRVRVAFAIAFFAILPLLYNPFFDPPTPLKFGGVLAIATSTLGLMLTLLPRLDARRLDPAFLLFVFSLMIALLRMNDTIGDVGAFGAGSTLPLASIQMSFAIGILLASTAAFRILGNEAFLQGCGLWAVLIALYILLNFPFVVYPAISKRLGEFSIDSYQEISLILGLACLFCYSSFLQRPRSVLGIVAGLLAVIFLLLVLNNRARGEFLALCVAMAFRFAPRLALVAVAFLFINKGWLVSLIESSDLAVMQRFARVFEHGTIGEREYIFSKSAELLGSDLLIAFFGGGANYFQHHFNLPFGYYPHNLILEGWISGGLVMLALILYLYVWPVARAYRLRLLGRPIPEDAMAISTFILLIHLKSGTMISAWTLFMFFPVFSELRRFGRDAPPIASQGLPDRAP